MKKMMKTALLMGAAACAPALMAQVVIEQQDSAGPQTQFWVGAAGVAGVAMAPQAATMHFVATEEGFDPGAAVKGAPYSSEFLNEFVQTLSDGTRIVRKSTRKMARDSEGRTRNEQGGQLAGPIGADMPQMVIINDPVAKELIYLHEQEKTATRVPMMRVVLDSEKFEGIGTRMSTTNGDVVFQRAVPPPPPAPAPGGAGAASVAYTAIRVLPGGKDGQRESTGKQVIAGVSCDGTRITNSIPAGQIGNDREIRVVTETCFSPELKLTLWSRTVDPLNGETTFRVASLTRAEPAKGLFQIPAGYSVEDNSVPAPAVPATPGVRTRVIRKQ